MKSNGWRWKEGRDEDTREGGRTNDLLEPPVRVSIVGKNLVWARFFCLFLNGHMSNSDRWYR